MSEARRRVALQPAWLLHHRPYLDTSRLLELWTRDFGRVAMVARGVRRPRSALRALLQPFRPLLVSWSARGELGTLTGAEAGGAGTPLPHDSLYPAWYMNELLIRLTERDDPNPGLFEDYRRALAGLADGAVPAPILRVFEKRLLDGLGYGLNLTHDVRDGEPLQAGADYEFLLEQGAVAVNATVQGTQDMIFSGASLLALNDECFDATPALDDAQRLLRAALRLYLGNRPLRVREVARSTARARRRSR